MQRATIWLRNGIVLAGVLGWLGSAGVGPGVGMPRAAAGQFQNGLPAPGGQQPGSRGTGMPGDRPDDRSPFSKDTQEKMAKARNDERQKRLISDSEKLLALATELHEQVLKTDKNILSVDVVRKATEMEKLSRDLKERMKG